MKRTPPIHTKGLFTLKQPFQLDPTKLYEVFAIRDFRDLEQKGVDVFETYYEPNGLDRSQFRSDDSDEASIITLISEDNDIVFVPDTFILSFPDQGSVKYQHVVLSVNFGALPDFLDFDHTIEQIQTVATGVIGKQPEVNTHIAPTRNAITPDDHQVLEASRRQNIDQLETDRARLLEQQRINADLRERNATLEQILIDNGLVTNATN